MARKNAKRKMRIVDQIPQWLNKFFATGEYLKSGEPGVLDVFMLQGDLLSRGSKGKTNEIWDRHKDYVLGNWISKYPGRRPWIWWIFDAPRWGRSFKGWWYDGTLPEPRRRLGGIGTPAFECLAFSPSFNFGVPDHFVTPTLVEMLSDDFSGVAIDLDDPPVYESQATYLKRHGLLTEDEEKRLTAKDFEPELDVLGG